MFFLLRSKSTSDIQADPAVARQVRYEEMQKYREQIRESEDKWQDVSRSALTLTIPLYRHRGLTVPVYTVTVV